MAAAEEPVTTAKPPRKHRSTTGGPGPRNVEMAGWRRQVRERRLKFDDDRKRIFLEHFARTGRYCEACEMADVSQTTPRGHLELDPDFAEAFQAAKDAYRDRVHRAVELVAIEGVEEPILGGRFKDEVVATKRVFYPQILLAEMRRVDPSYRDRQEIDMTVKGGVLVAPAALSPADWAAKFGKKDEEPPALEPPTIEG